MNKVILMGRLARDPELRYTQGAQGTAVCNYSLAVNRGYKREGEPDADFINIVAFGNRAEFANKYFKKGMMVAVVGELRVNSYTDKEGNKRWSTDVVVSEQHFAESRASFESRSSQQSRDFAPAEPQSQVPPASMQAPADLSDGFSAIDSEIEGDKDLPF